MVSRGPRLRSTDLQRDEERFSSSFQLSVDQLGELHDPKSLKKLIELGGIDSIITQLETDKYKGLPDNIPDSDSREEIYGENFIPQRPPKGFFALCWEALQDKLLIMLSIGAIVSLALGLYQTFGQPPQYDDDGNPEPKVEWVEGVAIMIAIVTVTVVGAANDYNKERQFANLNSKRADREVIVFRSGNKQYIPIADVVVGDLIYVETGDVVPADAVLVTGACECDESSLTGETHTIRKLTADIATQKYYESLEEDDDATIDIGSSNEIGDPMLISGSKLLAGNGKAIVTAVGPNSMHGKIMMSLDHEDEETPLQARLSDLADGIAYFGFASAILLFIVLFVKFVFKLNGPFGHLTSAEKINKFVNIIITSITIVVVAVPEGLPLAVTLALAFATTRMTQDGNLVRVLKSCETMGSATAICSDKTGTLTENKMRIVKGFFGEERFDDTASTKNVVTSNELKQKLNSNLTQDFLTNITLNSTAFENKQHEDYGSNRNNNDGQNNGLIRRVSLELLGRPNQRPDHTPLERIDEYIGSKTECALLLMAKDTFHAFDRSTLEEIREQHANSIVQTIPFESSRKCSGIVVKVDDGYRLYVKGASEMVFKRCTSRTLADGSVVKITKNAKSTVDSRIVGLAEEALRTISLAHRDFKNMTSWPPMSLASHDDPSTADPDLLFGAEVTDYPLQEADSSDTTNSNLPKIVINDYSNFDHESKDGLVLDAVVGIQDPLRPGVKDAVYQCYRAGVRVRMVTGDNIDTARAISLGCGILDDENKDLQYSCMEGPVFRKLSLQARREIVPHLCVLARSSPEDKKILVETLKDLGEVVAVTGDGTNDAPALKLADVGFSMGISGTEVAREASDIILMTDNFKSIVDAIKWGRTVGTSIRKFVQFQLTVNVTAVLLTFVSAVASKEGDSVLTAVQLLWVNLIMDTLAALALATDKPDDDVLNRKPMGRHAPLISTSMWKMIFGQSLVQLMITFVLHFRGDDIFFPGGANSHQSQQVSALTFNTFVWLQVFNLLLARKLDEGDGLTKLRDRISRENLDFTQHLFRNMYFIVILIFIGGFQIIIMIFGGAAFSVSPQTRSMWATAIICGFISLPAGVLIRIIPDIWVEKLFPTRLYNFICNSSLLHSLFNRREPIVDDTERLATAGNHADSPEIHLLTVSPTHKLNSPSLFTRDRSASTESTIYPSSVDLDSTHSGEV
ncbi:hypothetical protein B5S28_g2309 [[Candida] boidinii]|nr:hypothetical protein B5S28_g2309 [[Candida] boidinii]OWB61240.1 hypothetical protein B5S29_g2127 [[Candida] boidinii]OWB73517.1 hypothetical protein B5S31_g3263 [[Candida] boidinii]